MRKGIKGVKEIPAAFKGIEDAAEFWDTASLTDYEAYLKDVEVEVSPKSVRHLVALDDELLREITKVARSKGVTTETLVNLWLKDKLAKTG